MNSIAVIGGGASGMMAALTAARLGADVTLYEHNNAVGKKILASGNGRCNIINTTASSEDYFGENPYFVQYALKQLPFETFEKFCHSIGLILDSKDDGRCYPLSNEAKSVVSVFKNSCINSGVKIQTEIHIDSISKNDNDFVIHSNIGKHRYDKVLIATGSEAAPQLGATTDGYGFASSFGHYIVPTYPSLVQLHLSSNFHQRMSGIKTVAEVHLYINGKKEDSVNGDILFANYGISGLAILDISQKASLALLNHERVDISLNLLPRYNRQSLISLLEKLSQSIPEYSTETFLSSILPSKIAHSLLKSCDLDPIQPVSSLSSKSFKKIAHTIQDWRFEVTDTHGFKHAEVSGGGVSTSQINPKTMESTLVKGLYFAGEVLDIVGRRGGFNFHFAWASGMLAGKEMAK